MYEQVIPKSLEYYLDIALPDYGGCCDEEECNDGACHKKGKKSDNDVAEESDWKW